MEEHKSKCYTHQEFFPKEDEERYDFEFNSLEGICKRCQEQVAKKGSITKVVKEREQKALRYDADIQVRVPREVKATLDYIASRKGVNKADVYREAFDLYIIYREDYEF